MNMPVKHEDFNGLVSESLKTTSRVIAEKFGKQHKDVLRAIRNLESSADFNERNFAPVEFIEEFQFKSEKRVEYHITRDGFTFLAMGFTGKAAAAWKEQFIAAFNAMEAKLRDGARPTMLDLNDPAQLVPLLASYAQRTQVAEAKVVQFQPKAEAFDRLDSAEGNLTVRPAAKVLGMPEVKFTKWLEMNRWAFRQSGKGPLQAYVEKRNAGYVDHKLGRYHDNQTGEDKVSVTMVITPKGLARLAKLIGAPV